MGTPGLPPEILSEIIAYLDTIKDKTTLRSMLFVSRTVSAIAMPHLYARLKLDEAQFAQLVEGSRDDPSRRLQRFGLIHHLELCPPPSAATMAGVYEAVGRDREPLFPNVKTLRLEHRDHWRIEDYTYSVQRSIDGDLSGLPPKEMALFEHRTVQSSSLTVHTGDLDVILGHIRRGWKRLVVYDTDAETLQHPNEQAVFVLLTKKAEGYSVEPTMVYLSRDDEREGNIRQQMEHEKRRMSWDPPTPECLVFDDNAPACSICGLRWEDFWDEFDADKAATEASA
ncbi:uncharacterized protein LOC62_04G006094 [Vanrija pseudolonga]|uniref:F-box domain-containing protein n=1 Tax=Vanrija pseudolonga TaxID=143232 RepID=A0AAF0YF30_9TREE|nr:hypothetical protein LOC62_04G006094 [Vanrija pseudolonga]